MSQILSWRELAIDNPRKNLNNYCKSLAQTLPDSEIDKVCQMAKKEFKGLITEHYFNNYVDSIYKDEKQREKGLLRHKDENKDLTKNQMAKSFYNWLKKQPTSLVNSYHLERIAMTDPNIQIENYMRNR